MDTRKTANPGAPRVSFVDAAGRHWSDAGLLSEQGRRENADHLYGLAAECALKALLQALGIIRLDSWGAPLPRHFKVHVDALWGQFLAFTEGVYGAKYGAYLEEDNPYANWSVTDRYAAHDCVTEQVLHSHQRAAEATMKMLEAAWLDGRIRQ